MRTQHTAGTIAINTASSYFGLVQPRCGSCAVAEYELRCAQAVRYPHAVGLDSPPRRWPPSKPLQPAAAPLPQQHPPGHPCQQQQDDRRSIVFEFLDRAGISLMSASRTAFCSPCSVALLA